MIMAEQVARGVKPLASMSVSGADPGEIELFLRSLNRDRPAFTRALIWRLEPWGIWRVYTEGIRIQDTTTRHTLMGFLYGYSVDDIVQYIKYNRGQNDSDT